MQYINNLNNEFVDFRISLSCNVNYNCTPKEIVYAFKQYSDIKEYKTIKSRTEYLDKELRGVEISKENYEATITPNKIRLSIESEFEDIYSELKSYFKNNILEFPNKNEFIFESIILYSDNKNINIYIDKTKTNKSNKMLNQIYLDDNTNITGHIGQIDNMIIISFAWENKKYTYEESIQYVRNVLNHNIFYVHKNI